MPWEHPRPDGLLTPGQVRRHFTGIWSGWVLRLAHPVSEENPPDATSDNVRSLHSTTKWPGGLRHAPLDLTISCPNFKVLSNPAKIKSPIV